MKEIICLNIGQAGVQINNAVWELFCIEHGLDCDGNTRTECGSSTDGFLSGLYTIFQEGQSSKFTPRAINVDLEPTVIDEIRMGPYRNLWHPDMLISGLEDASNNFARGYFTIGKRMFGDFTVQLNKLIRECENLHGFVIINSYGGGTGSGFSNLALDYMNTEYAKNTKVGLIIFPSSQMSTAVVEPYNCILGAISSIENIDLALLFDNEAMFDSCYNKMNIFMPTYTNINRILSQVLSSLTVTIRFGSSLDHDLSHLQTNLVPYPQMHFPFVNFSPMLDQSKVDHKTMSTVSITRDLFDPSHQLLKCDVNVGKYMACCIQYRGLILSKDVNTALQEIKQDKNITFVDWCPTGFKVGICSMPPSSIMSKLAVTNKNCTMFYNSSAIEKVWDRVVKKFTELYRKKSFIHWYVSEGMEESEFGVIKERIIVLQRDYREISEATSTDGSDIRPTKHQKDRLRSGMKNDNSRINANTNNPTLDSIEFDESSIRNSSTGNSTSNSLISDIRRNEIRYLLKTMRDAKSNNSQ